MAIRPCNPSAAGCGGPRCRQPGRRQRHFFIYDVIKIFILLSVLIYGISWVQSYFPPERTRRIPGGHKGIGANIMAALLGTLSSRRSGFMS
jgi:uncharacterized membrane protein YraQ (UPF0718 family)